MADVMQPVAGAAESKEEVMDASKVIKEEPATSEEDDDTSTAASEDMDHDEDDDSFATLRKRTPEETSAYHDKVLALYLEQIGGENRDKTAARNESVFPMPNFIKEAVVPMLENELDWTAAEMFMGQFIVVVPLMVLFCLNPSHMAGFAFLAARLIVFGSRFILTLHVTSHRRLFKQKYWPLNLIGEYILAPTLGMPPGFYYLHHVMMHHAENNVFPTDVSSTMPHQRDSFLSLLHYLVKYHTHAVFYLPYYALKKKRYQLFLTHSVCWLAYFVGGHFLYVRWPVQTLWMLHMPFVFLGVALMQGNFAQHIFVCPDQPFSNYRLTFNYVNHPENQRTFNDGYHIVHHANSRLHWSKWPQHFEDNIHKFADNDAFLFKEVDFQFVFWCVFTGNYEKLYKQWVQLTPGKKRTVEEFEAICRHRLQPIYKYKST